MKAMKFSMRNIMAMKTIWKSFQLIILFCLLSCSDNNHQITEEPDPEEPGIEVVEPELFRANRIFIRHGLQLQCWVATDNYELAGAAGQPAYNLSIPDWKLTGFTGPTFYGPPLINTSYFKEFPDSQWAIAKAPHADQLKKAPTDYEEKNGFLSEDQLKYLDNLTTICFGDEEAYKFENVKILKAWYDVARRLYPDALLHNNQYANQWSENDMRTYIRLAKPDLITYDWYYFHTWDAENYIGAKDMAAHLITYRILALEGWSGKKDDYLAFGQYTLGFVNEGTYKLTESQLRLYYYMTWTFGGKWLNWFRFLQGDGYGGQTAPTDWSLLLEQGMPGQPTKYMDWVNRCNQESKYISDYLVRLKTKNVAYIPGSKKYTEGTPAGMSAFRTVDSFLKQIEGSLDLNPNESADMYIGFFDIIPKEEQGDPTFFKEKNPAFFMLTNGYASKQVELAEPLKQRVTFQIDFTNFETKKLSWIHPESGVKEEIMAETTDGNVGNFQVTLSGGSGALFIVE